MTIITLETHLKKDIVYRLKGKLMAFILGKYSKVFSNKKIKKP